MQVVSRGWSGAVTVSSVTPRNPSVSKVVATVPSSALLTRTYLLFFGFGRQFEGVQPLVPEAL